MQASISVLFIASIVQKVRGEFQITSGATAEFVSI